MELKSPQGIDEFLKPTIFCDCGNDEIKRQSQELLENVKAPKEAALNIFNFVRDHILFGLDLPCTKASETLKKATDIALQRRIFRLHSCVLPVSPAGTIRLFCIRTFSRASCQG